MYAVMGITGQVKWCYGAHATGLMVKQFQR